VRDLVVQSVCLSVYFLLMACLFMLCTLVPNGFDYSIALLFWRIYLCFIKINNCKYEKNQRGYYITWLIRSGLV